MFDIHFERDDETSTEDVLRHPLAEEIDDYKAYKRCCKEQRDVEKTGALRLGSLNYRATSQMNLSKRDFQEQFRRPSDIESDRRHPREETRISRTPSLHRMEVTHQDFAKRHFDGSNEEIAEDFITALSDGSKHSKEKHTPPKNTRGWGHMEPVTSIRSMTSRHHRRDESYDGGGDSAPAAPHPGTQVPLGTVPPRIEQGQIGPPLIATRFTDVNWNPSPRFHEIDWNPPLRTPPRRQSRVSNASTRVANIQSFDGTFEPASPIPQISPRTVGPNSPVIDQNEPVKRGIFEAIEET